MSGRRATTPADTITAMILAGSSPEQVLAWSIEHRASAQDHRIAAATVERAVYAEAARRDALVQVRQILTDHGVENLVALAECVDRATWEYVAGLHTTACTPTVLSMIESDRNGGGG